MAFITIESRFLRLENREEAGAITLPQHLSMLVKVTKRSFKPRLTCLRKYALFAMMDQEYGTSNLVRTPTQISSIQFTKNSLRHEYNATFSFVSSVVRGSRA